MKRIFQFTLFLGLLWGAGSLHAFMVLQRNLESLAQDADKIFLGKVVSIDPCAGGKHCDVITFEVIEGFKGDLEKTVTITQVSARRTELPDGTVVQTTQIFGGVPVFKESEEALVLLAGDSKIGLTTTVGFGQGRFRVVKDQSGSKKLINDFKNQGLFDGMSLHHSFKSQGLTAQRFQALQSQPQDLYLDQMRTILNGLAQEQP